MSQREVSAVIVGAGERGANAYGPRIHRRGVGRIVGLAEPDDGRRRAAAVRFAVAPDACFRTWDELFARPRMADVAVVTTGDTQHVEPTLLALARGYHVLLEKPMALDDDGCRRIVEAAEAAQRNVVVCHVYRHSHLFAALRRVVASGALGRVLSIQLSENVAYWHYAHSYVRGLTRQSRVPMLLQKSCHDLDLLAWIAGAPARTVTSLLRPTELTAANAPPGAPERCSDGCAHAATCPYDAVALYARLEPVLNDLARHERLALRALAATVRLLRPAVQQAPLASVRRLAEWRRWPLTAVSNDASVAAVDHALRTTRWGRCAWRVGDNDQPAAQTVDVAFANGVLASFTMHSSAHRSMRRIRVDGTHGSAVGELAGLEQWLEVSHHKTGTTRRTDFPVTTDGHGGGEGPLIEELLRAVREGTRAATSARDAWESHRIAFAAMRSAASGVAVRVDGS
jgi:predicted dehydrogenase